VRAIMSWCARKARVQDVKLTGGFAFCSEVVARRVDQSPNAPMSSGIGLRLEVLSQLLDNNRIKREAQVLICHAPQTT
jgi:hypothetical protein